jgi:ABC-type uncharacterized transport system permease subunit
MTINAIGFLAFILYGGATISQWLSLSNKLNSSRFSKFRLIFVGLLAVILHSYLLYKWIDTPEGQNLSLVHLSSLVCWLISAIVLLTLSFKPIENLTLFILPITAISIPIAMLFPSQDIYPTRYHPGALSHILISIAAFSMLGAAALQATLLYFQNHLIRQKSCNGILRLLPPLQTMERLLFQIIGIGFVCLSGSLITAFLLDTQDLAGIQLQKVVFSFLAWFLFAILLYGRFQSGLRGPKATHWTLIGVILLMVAYLGGKWVRWDINL